MLDREIPYYNLILRCDARREVRTPLPEGYAIRRWEPDDRQAWAQIEHEIGDFSSLSEAEGYFAAAYLPHGRTLRERGLVAVDAGGRVVGTCFAWHGTRQGRPVASLHWLAVAPDEQGKGLGKALCAETLRLFERFGEFPVYLHTQPWSWKAVMIYYRQGFRLCKVDTFDGYENQFAQAVETLEKVLPEPLLHELLEEVYE